MKTIVNKFYYLDTEFYKISNMYVVPVCASLVVNGQSQSYIHPQHTPDLINRLRILHAEGYICHAYAAEAECRYMQAIGIDPLREGFRFIDLYILYRLLANKFDEIQYGKHLVGGRVRVLKKPPCKWDIPDMSKEEVEKAKGDGSQMEYNLMSATFKFCDVIRDSEDKKAARDRIIAGGPFTDEEMAWIVRYCEDDTKFLPELSKKMLARYRQSVPGASIEKLVHLSSYAVHTAEMVRIGYPVQHEWLRKIVDNVPFLILELCWKLLEESKKLNLDFVPLTFDRKEKKFTENQKLIKQYIEHKYPNAARTDKGNISLEEDELIKLAHYAKNDPPEGVQLTFVDLFVRYRMMLKTIKSFRPGKGKRGIYDYMGEDGRIRPNFGIFVAQTSRSQPASSGFIFLKSSQLRHLVQPAEGKMLVGIDYSSQEFLINAILANDDAMLAAYKSGDPYLFLGKRIGTIPPDGTKDKYKPQRNEAKDLELGLSYGMGANGVSVRIGTTVERAKYLMERRAELYWKLTDYRNDLRADYRSGLVLTLPDGWAHGPDNDNDLSMLNMPTQGTGAVIMREAVRMSHEEGLPVIQTLHDALYYEFDYGDWEAVDKAVTIMVQAFKNIMGDHEIRVEAHAWGPNFKEGYVLLEDGKQTHYTLKTPQGNTVSYEKVFWEDRVSVKERDYWHNFVKPTALDTL